MKTKKNSAFTFAIVAIYVLTVVIYFSSLFIEYKKGEEKASNRFNEITKDVSRISLANSVKTKQFYDEILNSLGNIADIAGIQLNYGNELIFSYPKDMKDLNNIKGYLVSFKTTKVFAATGIPVIINASIYKLKPSSIFYKGRIAFLVILVSTIFTAIYLITFVKNGTFPTEAENDDLDEDEIDYPDVSTYDLTPEETSEIKNQLSSLNENDIENIEEEIDEEDEDVLAFLDEEKAETTEDLSNEIESYTDNETKTNSPKGLFCPDTGFGWEEYMLTRLDSELLRSAQSDQDLSLFSIRIPGIDWNSECGKNISRTVLEKIKFNDLVFNYGDDGISAIFQNQNTDQSLVTAESLYQDLTKILKENNSDLSISIGISSRSLRLISGSRLTNESIEALIRAMKDTDSPIIAFRVNPERYKDFLASESFQEKDRPIEKPEDEKFLESISEQPIEEQEELKDKKENNQPDDNIELDIDIDEELNLSNLSE